MHSADVAPTVSTDIAEIIHNYDQEIHCSDNNLHEITKVDKKNNLLCFLVNWSLEQRVNLIQLSSLLKGLNNIFPDINIPRDGRTLLKTGRKFKIIMMKSSKGDDGEFVYFGIAPMLHKYMLIEDLKQEIVKCGVFQLIFNIDGLPLFNSSNKQFWPILCRLNLNGIILSPFPVALYFGTSKPFSTKNYLESFVTELNILTCNGFLHNEGVLPVNIFCITADAPARAFLKGIKSHNGHFGCERCIQKGTYSNRRIVFNEINSNSRNHDNFLNRVYPEHHISETPLLYLQNIDLVKVFALDYMHLCCLGVMRKLLFMWIKGSAAGVRLPIHLRLELSKRLLRSSKYIPSDFNRKPRSLTEMERFKATYRVPIIHVIYRSSYFKKYLNQQFIFSFSFVSLCNENFT